MLKPMPGIVIIEPIEYDYTNVHIDAAPDKQIIVGRIISVGPDLMTDFGALIETKHYCKKGDIVSFLTYDEKFDRFIHDKKKYYQVKVQDLRSVINEK